MRTSSEYKIGLLTQRGLLLEGKLLLAADSVQGSTGILSLVDFGVM